MTSRICKGWHHMIGRWRDNIHCALERWRPSHLPETADHSAASVVEVVLKAHATYENGVLQITLPKTARATSTWVQSNVPG